jgi:hypothetical protein
MGVDGRHVSNYAHGMGVVLFEDQGVKYYIRM